MDVLTYNISIDGSCGQIKKCGVVPKSWISYYDNGIDNLVQELYNEAIRLTEIEIANGTFNRDLTMIEDFFINVYDEDEKITRFSRLYYLRLPAGAIADFRRLGYSREISFDISFNDSKHYTFSHKSEMCWINMTREEIFGLVKSYLPAKRKLLEVEKIAICPGDGYKETEIRLYPWERLGYYRNIISMEEPKTKEEIKPVPCDCGGVFNTPEFYISKDNRDFYMIALRCPTCFKKIEAFLTANLVVPLEGKDIKRRKEKIIRAWNALNNDEEDN